MSNEVRNVADVDKNFKVDSNIKEPDIVWFDVKNEPFSIHGISFDENQNCSFVFHKKLQIP